MTKRLGVYGAATQKGGRMVILSTEEVVPGLVAFLDQVGLAADDRVGYTEAPSGFRAALMYS